MKSTTAEAQAMTDEQLAATEATLRKSLPRAQALLDAVRREKKRRARRKAKAA